jgi:hypothetical protein
MYPYSTCFGRLQKNLVRLAHFIIICLMDDCQDGGDQEAGFERRSTLRERGEIYSDGKSPSPNRRKSNEKHGWAI